MRAPITEAELRAAWQRLRMVGDFDSSMRHRAVHRAVESAARAMQARKCDRPGYDAKRRAANDQND
ncbi:hypothetical protein [Paraburkholderia phenoliruptrix]|uniref:hypothetical protein n=1 Tax=Paraburkholderia phenoliruptrix TaxID=252970 RepID=UPI0028559663|nr:hypothetical protein [Paraburkholderia phenoliruptrix]MDR6387594.1 putative phage tail protein [Paraburkholderia phenoliruptrix]